jgi:hypothetical protein
MQKHKAFLISMSPFVSAAQDEELRNEGPKNKLHFEIE